MALITTGWPALVGGVPHLSVLPANKLRSLRNYHAHRYGEIPVSTEVIKLRSIANCISFCGRVLNDLRILVDNSSFALPSLEPSQNNVAARDVVDLLLMGSIQFAISEWAEHGHGPYLWQQRDAYYKQLHSRRRKSAKDSFNGPLKKQRKT